MFANMPGIYIPPAGNLCGIDSGFGLRQSATWFERPGEIPISKSSRGRDKLGGRSRRTRTKSKFLFRSEYDTARHSSGIERLR